MADYPFTISSTRVSPLSEQEEAATGFNLKFKVLYSDITAAAAANTVGDTAGTVTVTLGSTPTGWYIDKALGMVKTAFTGVTSQALSVAVGTTSAPTALISAQSVFTAGPLEMASTVPILTSLQGASAVSLVATFTNSAGGTPSTITGGDLDLYLHLKNTANLP